MHGVIIPIASLYQNRWTVAITGLEAINLRQWESHLNMYKLTEIQVLLYTLIDGVRAIPASYQLY